jgi:hypothetical protein
MRSIFTFLFLFVFSFIHAQDLTGVWQGHFRSRNLPARNSIFDDRYKFEVQIAQRDKALEAITYSYLSSVFYGKASASGTVNGKTSKVLLQEIKLLEVRNQSGDVCIMTCFLTYAKEGSEEFLEGTYVSMNLRDSTNCGRGAVFLRKVPQSDFYKEPFLVLREKELDRNRPRNPPETAMVAKPKNPTGAIAKRPDAAKTTTTTPPPSRPATTKPVTKPPARIKEAETAPLAKASVPQAPGSVIRLDSSSGIGRHFSVITPKVLQSRQNVLARSITVNTREVTLNIYDDGAIDHDTVSIYLDKKMIISHAMLTDRPLVLTLHLDEGDDYHELVMVAENEGEIPPNTSLMIVKAGDKEYEVRITSTEQKNAMVTFRYQKSPLL